MWNSHGCRNSGTKSKWKYFPKLTCHGMLCVCKLFIPKPWLVTPEFSHAVLDSLSLWTDLRIAGCCFLVVLQSFFCFSGRQVLLMRFGCIWTLNLLHFPPSQKTRPFPNTPSPSGTHCGDIGVLRALVELQSGQNRVQSGGSPTRAKAGRHL